MQKEAPAYGYRADRGFRIGLLPFWRAGHAVRLWAGARNFINCKIYSGGEPDLEEGDVFKLTVPLEWHKDIINEMEHISITDKVTEKVTEERQVTDLLRKDLGYITTMLAEMLGISRKTVSKRLKSLKDKGIIERVGSDRKGYWNFFCNRGVNPCLWEPKIRMMSLQSADSEWDSSLSLSIHISRKYILMRKRFG